MMIINGKKFVFFFGAIIILNLLLYSIKNTNCNKTINTMATIKNKYEILVDVEESKLYVINKGIIAKIFSCSGGKWNTPSPIGTWKIIKKAKWGEGFRRLLDGT